MTRRELTAHDVQKVVERAIFPFKTGNVEVWTEPDFYSVGYKLTVKIGTVPQPCVYVVGEKAAYILSEDELLDSFYETIWRHYRYRKALPVENHIILGEN